jgi:hypothetical protein
VAPDQQTRPYTGIQISPLCAAYAASVKIKITMQNGSGI